MYDVIVVGARCAGSPTAMLLARAGYRVLLLDRVRFPRDTLSSHYIHQPGTALLDRWGLLAQVRDSGCPPLERVRYEAADISIRGCSPPVEGQRAAFAPRRHVLDPLLAEGAVAAGAELRQECRVDDLLFDGDRVTGVAYTTPRGQRSVERARLVVGADGMRSLVARRAEAPVITEDRRLTCTYYSYWEGLPADFELYERPGRWIGVIPTNDALTLVMTYFPQADFDTVRAAAEPAHLEAVRTTAPRLRERMSAARRVERLYGTGDQQNYLRQAAGPGWALVGDAAHHKDSIAARGITDAFLQAQLLVESIGTGLDDGAQLDAALARYAGELEQRFMGFYRSTLTTAELRVPESRLSLLRAISGHQDLVDRYFGTLSGACGLDDFYNEDLLDLLALS
ncbi:NAD(P)/FAD-dependent oxidoreductase [Streptomyces sp. NRRL B-1347]|uniref:NAD(P)/FAD-dependent oxidoreductase n=1 Tax=Streptomyces sp. NRRL B-1347 TaxID=1476877 RepID=UPI0004C98513|nr:NAD(P)/FAD-dependent oxidoreductase [Streptomyces sp. NRRL B-1347]